MEYKYTLRLFEDGRKFFGPGAVELLNGVMETGSLRASAARMGMAYSKAWKMLQNAEEVLGFPLVQSQPGGKNGGRTEVTQEGKAFLKKYCAFSSDLRHSAKLLFDKYFKEGKREDEA